MNSVNAQNYQVESNGDIRIHGSIKGKFEDNGDILVNGSIKGKIESNGDIRKNGSIVGKVESNGDVRLNGSIVGKIESNGDVRKNGSIVGSSHGASPREAAVMYFFEFFWVKANRFASQRFIWIFSFFIFDFN